MYQLKSYYSLSKTNIARNSFIYTDYKSVRNLCCQFIVIIKLCFCRSTSTPIFFNADIAIFLKLSAGINFPEITDLITFEYIPFPTLIMRFSLIKVLNALNIWSLPDKSIKSLTRKTVSLLFLMRY